MSRFSVRFTFFFFLTTLLTITGLHAQSNSPGAIYTMTNATSGNEVIAYTRASNGALTESGRFATQGLGTGAGLGNQGAVRMSPTGRRLLVVNPGSDEITLFRIRPEGLQFHQKISSGGQRPISITIRNSLIYVLNAGGMDGATDNIAGFKLDKRGRMNPIANSSRPLSTGSTDPAQIEFSRDGKVLIVTEKATNMISTFLVNADGTTTGPEAQASAGDTPFGFAFGISNRLFVSEAFENGADESAVSSYTIGSGGILQPIAASQPTTETAACWVVITSNGRFLYTTNTGSGTISGFRISSTGTLTLLNADGLTANVGTGSMPIDMALSANSRFLYTLNSGTNEISAFRVSANGSLTHIGTNITGLPAGTNGLAGH